MLPMRDRRQVLADWVRSEREKRNWSQSDLADRMGKVRAVVNKIENGGTDPTLETLALLAKALNYSLPFILDLIGFDVGANGDDPWVKEMNHKIRKIKNPSLRRFVENVIDTAVNDEETEQALKRKTKVKPATS